MHTHYPNYETSIITSIKKRAIFHLCTYVKCVVQTVGCCSLLDHRCLKSEQILLHFSLLGCSYKQTKYDTCILQHWVVNLPPNLQLVPELPQPLLLLFGMNFTSSTTPSSSTSTLPSLPLALSPPLPDHVYLHNHKLRKLFETS